MTVMRLLKSHDPSTWPIGWLALAVAGLIALLTWLA